MTTIIRDDIQHLAALSSLQLDNEEIDSLRIDIERIIQYIDLLAELDTEGVDPTYQVTGLQNIWRDDVVESSIPPKELVELAESSSGSSVKVPKVL